LKAIIGVIAYKKVIVAVACFGLATVFFISGNQTNSCETVTSVASNTHNNMSVQCIDNTQKVSWVKWILHKSKSNQFHFLDLLELLSRNNK